MPKKGHKGNTKKPKKPKKNKEEIRRQRVRDELEREIKYGQKTIKLHEKRWKDMLIKISLPKLREDLRFAWQAFQRVIDFKDYKISLLMDELDFAEKQRILKASQHCESIDNLMKEFHNQIEDMEAGFNKTIEEFRSAGKDTEDGLKKRAEEEEIFLKTMLYGLAQIRKHNEKHLRGDMISKLDDEKNRFTEILGLASFARERMFENMVHETHDFVKNYILETHTRKNQYLALYRSDTAGRLLNARSAEKIVKMYNHIKRLKEKFQVIQDAKSIIITELKAKRQYFSDCYSEMTYMMRYIMKIEHDNMQRLVVSSNTTMTYLKEVEKKGRNMLAMMSVSNKLETLQEKIFSLPYSQPCASTNDEEKFSRKKKGDPMEVFWAKVGQIDKTRWSLMQERNELLNENALLRREISCYCRCLSCPTLPPIHPPDKSGRINKIDARDVARNYNCNGAFVF